MCWCFWAGCGACASSPSPLPCREGYHVLHQAPKAAEQNKLAVCGEERSLRKKLLDCRESGYSGARSWVGLGMCMGTQTPLGTSVGLGVPNLIPSPKDTAWRGDGDGSRESYRRQWWDGHRARGALCTAEQRCRVPEGGKRYLWVAMQAVIEWH